MTTEAQERREEYAMFGPWIDEVTEPARVPPLFRTHPITFAPDTVMLKVPRNIVRRDANPHMDLYDRLLILGPDALTVLTRNGIGHPGGRKEPVERGFTAERMDYSEVVAVDDSVNLLDGRYRIHSSGGSVVAFPFNGSGRAGLEKLTTTLRNRMATTNPRGLGHAGRALVAAGRGRAVDLEALSGDSDVALASSMRAVSRLRPDVVAWACHPRERLAPASPGIGGVWHRLTHVLSPAVLQGRVMGGDAHAWELVGRHEDLTRGSVPVYSDRKLTVSLAAIDTVSLADHPLYPRVVVATLTAGRCELPLLAPRDSAMHEVLAAAASASLP